MAVPQTSGAAPTIRRDHGFHPLRVGRVVRETDDAASVVLEVPDDLKGTYEYRAGQFLTLRLPIDGNLVTRSYSMSSSPDVGEDLQVTVKRVTDGLVSNWINDHVHAGDVIETSAPAGLFTLAEGTGDVVLFAGGSGITPVFSLMKTVLATTGRCVRLLYANRSQGSVIFAEQITDLIAAHNPSRITVEHYLEEHQGYVDDAAVGRQLSRGRDTDYYVCGPTPFMDVVEAALADAGIDPDRIHIERFLPAEQQPLPEADEDGEERTVEVDLYGSVQSGEHRAGTTILQTARSFGMTPPYGCEAGNCGSCMAMLDEGEVVMHVNDALTDEEVEEGWVLTCQAVPTSPCVKVRY